MRIVRTRSIPNVSDERLIEDLAKLHEIFHTVGGLYRFDGPRRTLLDNGMKIHKIVEELIRRGHRRPNCKFCCPPYLVYDFQII